MKHDFHLADIGEGLEEAEILQWLVIPGQLVERDQPVVEIMTDKSNAELPAPVAGVVVALAGDIGDIVRVGELLVVFDDDPSSDLLEAADSHAERRPDNLSPDNASPDNLEAPTIADTRPDESAEGIAPIVRPKASPSTRQLAASSGIDLAQITGTGPGGRILRSDLGLATNDISAQIAPIDQDRQTISTVGAGSVTDNNLEPGNPADAPPTASRRHQVASVAHRGDEQPTSGEIPLRGVRRSIATHMTQSWSTIPHIHSFDEIDAEPLLALQSQLRSHPSQRWTGLTPLAFFVAAMAKALRNHPLANASIDVDAELIRVHDNINIGVAVASPNGLVVPVLRTADRLNLSDTNRQLRVLVDRARGGELTHDDTVGGTGTITNFGSLGGQQATPLIRPPESIIVGFGAVAARPFVIESAVVARMTMHVVVGADHRLLDGDVVTSILADIAALLTNPLDLLLND